MSASCRLRSSETALTVALSHFPPHSPIPRFHFPRPLRGVATPVHSDVTAQLSVSQEKRLTSANPGSASGGGPKGDWWSWWRYREARGIDLCNGESTCTRASGLISEPRWIHQDQNDLIPVLIRPFIYASISDYTSSSLFFFYFSFIRRVGTLPRTDEVPLYPSFYLCKDWVFYYPREKSL